MKRQLAVLACVLTALPLSAARGQDTPAATGSRFLNALQVGQTVLLSRDHQAQGYRLRLIEEQERVRIAEYQTSLSDVYAQIDAEYDAKRQERKERQEAWRQKQAELRREGDDWETLIEKFKKMNKEFAETDARLGKELNELQHRRIRKAIPDDLQYLGSDLQGEQYQVTAVGDDFVALQRGKTERLIPVHRIDSIFRKATVKEE